MGCCRSRAGADSGIEDEIYLRAASERAITAADGEQFIQPVEPLSVSGGTAAFYRLRYRPDVQRPPGHSECYWVGKDLAHAKDEIDFYERAQRLRRGADGPPERWRLLNWLFEYGGLAKVNARGVKGPAKQPRSPGARPVDVLLLRNLYDGCERMRLLDVKIGSCTAVGGWQGKSHFNAAKNRLVDQATNSTLEGFRLEGFDNAPDALEALLDACGRDRLQGVGTGGLGLDLGLEIGGKKSRRLALQRLSAAEFFTFWTLPTPSRKDRSADPSDERPPGSPRRHGGSFATQTPSFNTAGSSGQVRGGGWAVAAEDSSLTDTHLCAAEVAQCALATAARELLHMMEAAAAVPVPQQWIGSSIAFGFDVLARPPRLPGQAPPDGARVCVFDWGRSELTTRDIYDSLPADQRKQRARYWAGWLEGLSGLAFGAVRQYRRQYCPSGGGWRQIRFKVWSYSSTTDLVSSVMNGAVLGTAELPLCAMDEGEVRLEPPDRNVLTQAVGGVVGLVGDTARTLKSAVDGSPRGEHAPRLRISVAGPIPPPEPHGSVLQKEQWRVNVVSARNLPSALLGVGGCHAVVSVALVDAGGNESVQHTRLLYDTPDPKWNETLVFAAASAEWSSPRAVVPAELLARAPSGPLSKWDLGPAHPEADSESARKLGQALKKFRHIFLRPKDSAIPARPAALSIDSTCPAPRALVSPSATPQVPALGMTTTTLCDPAAEATVPLPDVGATQPLAAAEAMQPLAAAPPTAPPATLPTPTDSALGAAAPAAADRGPPPTPPASSAAARGAPPTLPAPSAPTPASCGRQRQGGAAPVTAAAPAAAPAAPPSPAPSSAAASAPAPPHPAAATAPAPVPTPPSAPALSPAATMPVAAAPPSPGQTPPTAAPAPERAAAPPPARESPMAPGLQAAWAQRLRELEEEVNWMRRHWVPPRPAPRPCAAAGAGAREGPCYSPPLLGASGAPHAAGSPGAGSPRRAPRVPPALQGAVPVAAPQSSLSVSPPRRRRLPPGIAQ